MNSAKQIAENLVSTLAFKVESFQTEYETLLPIVARALGLSEEAVVVMVKRAVSDRIRDLDTCVSRGYVHWREPADKLREFLAA